MAVPESPIPAQLITGISTEVSKLVNATRMNVAATLTAAVLARTKGPVTPNEVLALQTDFYNVLFPENRTGAFQEWQKTRSERLAKEYG